MDTVWLVLIAAGAALFLLIALAAATWWRLGRSGHRDLVRRIGRLKLRDKLRLGGSLFAEPRVSWAVRVLAVGLVFYLALPVDIIPDVIPVLGYADDVLVLAIGAGLLIWAVNARVLEEHVARLEIERRHAEAAAHTPHNGAAGEA